MSILIVILSLFAVAAVLLVIWVCYGIVCCAEAQDESRDDLQ
jgi:hypothetical protein